MPPGTPPRLRVPAVIWALVIASTLPELLLTGADLRLWGDPSWRMAAYEYGGFWSGLLRDWVPTYPGQAFAMFATYGFLHGGLSHLALNMVTLIVFGSILAQRYGGGAILVLYGLSQIGGGLAYGLLSPADNVPMVGASGAIFGLAGAFLMLSARQLRIRGQSVIPVLKSAGALVLLNLVLWWAMAGGLAWQAHLGGALVGIAFVALVPPRRA
jgi:membrane associated rhomboid family serine protease